MSRVLLRVEAGVLDQRLAHRDAAPGRREVDGVVRLVLNLRRAGGLDGDGRDHQLRTSP